LVVIGLVINTSSSDLSIKKALGETIFTDNIHRSLKVAATGLLLWILSSNMDQIPTSGYPQKLFLFYVGGIFQIAAIVLILIGFAFYLFDDLDQLKSSATSDE
jgi:Na+/serine symporter